MSSNLTAEAEAPAAPRTLQQALDPAWLTHALRPVTGGATVTAVETVEVIRTMATKVRFKATWAGGSGAFCLKAFLDVDEQTSKGGATTITEADFYNELAPRMSVRVPECVATIIDRPGQQGVIIMRDLIVDGARFCTALEPFTADEAAASLDQIARLHARADLLKETPWIGRRIADFARNNFVPQPVLQDLLSGPRGDNLPSRTKDAGVLIEGLKALAARDEPLPQTLVHGDCHAGNIFRTADGPGLIDWQIVQRGGWALDVAYHVCAVLPVELAEAEEWRLLDHYLDVARGHGIETPDRETAREQYRTSVVYGYYLWAITRRVEPAITNLFVDRLGKAVTRHESFRRLGV
jgi:aminoglycoside phosphotransferase (APT) family kinase protein